MTRFKLFNLLAVVLCCLLILSSCVRSVPLNTTEEETPSLNAEMPQKQTEQKDTNTPQKTETKKETKTKGEVNATEKKNETVSSEDTEKKTEPAEDLSDATIDKIVKEKGTLGLSAKQYARYTEMNIEQEKYVNNEIFVKFKEGTTNFADENTLIKLSKNKTFRYLYDKSGMAIVLDSYGKDAIINAIYTVIEDSNVKYACPNYLSNDDV